MTDDEQLRSILRSELGPLLTRVEELRADLKGLHDEIGTIRVRVDGIPLTNRSLTILQQEMRSLKAAFNDFARTNVTAGEIEVLHEDVNRVQAENTQLATRIATLERLIAELRK
jgi:hypothetical protein